MSELLDVLDLSIDEMTAQVGEITDPEAIEALIEAENNGKTRKGALAVLEARLDALLNEPDDALPEPDAPPAWQAPDYTGPITADQAAWRHAHLK